MPQIAMHTETDENCSTCQAAKIRHHDRNKESSQRANRPWQGIGIDFGFVVQSSKNMERVSTLSGLNGEKCFVLLTDHCTGTTHGQVFCNKEPPVAFLNQWLRKHGCKADIEDRYVRFDGGGELGNCQEIRDLFSNAGYKIEPTAPKSSSQNGPVERPIQTIKRMMVSMLTGSRLPIAFWPYAFHHATRLYNVIPHGTKTKSPMQQLIGEELDLSYLRIFGCRVKVIPPSATKNVMDRDIRTGVFLGFTNTTKNIYYYDFKTSMVKTTQHVVFDETMVGLEDKSPDAQVISDINQGRSLDNVYEAEVEVPDFEISQSPFSTLKEFVFNFNAQSDFPVPFSCLQCDHLKRAYLASVDKAPKGMSLHSFQRQFIGTYVTAINDIPTFNVSDIEDVMTKMANESPTLGSIRVELAPLSKSEKNNRRRTPLHLQVNDIIRINSILNADVETKDCTTRNNNTKLVKEIDKLENDALKNCLLISEILLEYKEMN
jgi:hypothetical protein